MSIAAHPQREEIVCGVNSSQDALQSGQNQNCRVYNVKENKSVTRPPFFYAFLRHAILEYPCQRREAHWS